MMEFNGLSGVNVELTSRCNKNCWCCGRRKREQEDPSVLNSYGDMPWEMVQSIASQLPDNIVVQLHNNGEPLLYPLIREAIVAFKRQIISFDTNGDLLVDCYDRIINRVDTIAVSVIKDDPGRDKQLKTLKEFLRIKGRLKPLVVVRLNGEQDEQPYKDLGVIIAKRILHSPKGSFNYNRPVTVPEIGVCLEALHHLSIDRFGAVSMCVRFDPEGLGIIGNVNDQSLVDIWNGKERDLRVLKHLSGNRQDVPLCSKCEYFGVPTGW